MRALTGLLVIVALSGSAMAQEKKGKSLKLKDLPAAVQKTVEPNLNGGEIKNIAKITFPIRRRSLRRPPPSCTRS